MPQYDNPNRENVNQVQILPERMPATASPITDCRIVSRNAYVMSGPSILFMVPADEVIRFSDKYCTVRNNKNLETHRYDGEFMQSIPI